MDAVETSILVSTEGQELILEEVEIEGRILRTLKLDPVCALRVANLLISQATDIIEELGEE